MIRAEILASLGVLLTGCVLVGVMFIAIGITGGHELATRIVVVFAGIFIIVGGTVGVMRLKKLKYG